MWSNRWVRVGAVTLALFLVNGIARFISDKISPPEDQFVTATAAAANDTAQNVIAIVGVLVWIAVLTVAAAVWAVRHPVGRVVADLGAAALVAIVLTLVVGPFIGGGVPFQDGPEQFVIQFLQFLGFSALGVFVGFTTMVVLGKEWKTRGLAAYAQRHGATTRRPRPDRSVQR